MSRHDLIETETIKNPVFRVLLSFNTPMLPDVAEIIKNPLYTQVKVFEGRVIYQLIDQYLAWRDEQKRLQDKQRFEHVVMPAKIRLLPIVYSGRATRRSWASGCWAGNCATMST